MTPWWLWMGLLVLSLGAIMAAVVASRQSGHIAANRQTAREVESIANEVRSVKGEVHELRAFTQRIEAGAQRNSRRIEAVESFTGAETPADRDSPDDE